MEIRRTRRGTTIRLTERETTELQTSFALSIAAYGILQNFMTDGQKAMTLPSILFIARMGATLGDGGEPVRQDEQDGEDRVMETGGG